MARRGSTLSGSFTTSFRITIQKVVMGVTSLEIALNMVGALTILGLMLLISFDVLMRFLLNNPIPDSIQIALTAMAFIVFLPLGYVQAQKKNIQVEFLLKRFTPLWRSIFEIIVFSLGGMMFALITWESWKYFLESWTVNEEMQSVQLRIPYYIGKSAVPLGSFLVSVQFLIDAGREIIQLLGRKV